MLLATAVAARYEFPTTPVYFKVQRDKVLFFLKLRKFGNKSSIHKKQILFRLPSTGTQAIFTSYSKFKAVHLEYFAFFCFCDCF